MNHKETIHGPHNSPELMAEEIINRFSSERPDVLHDYISNTIFQLEDQALRKGRSTDSESRILFLIGSDTRDVTNAKTSNGTPIYTRGNLDNQIVIRPKQPEIDEFAGAISNHFYEQECPVHVLSESADIFWNLITLTKLDPDFQGSYMECINTLADDFEMNPKQTALLVISKYYTRYALNYGVKDFIYESAIIEHLITTGYLPKPNDDMFAKAYKHVSLMASKIFKTRLIQLQTINTWNGH